MYAFLIDVCRVNTFERRVKVGKDDAGRDKYHAVHEYSDTLKSMYTDFLDSSEFADFTRRTGRTNLCFSLFQSAALSCKCIRKPKMRVCVDEVEVSFGELLKCLNDIKRSTRGRCECAFCEGQANLQEELQSGITYYFVMQ